MKHRDFSFLKKHFGYAVFDLQSEHRFSEIIIQKDKEYFPDDEASEYGIAFYDEGSDYILNCWGSTSKDYDATSFEFYLEQLPTLELSDVAYFFALVNFADVQLLPNMFEFDRDYPSEFCRDFLKDTYGNVIDRYQLMQLIGTCIPREELSNMLLDEYRKNFNKRLKKTYDTLDSLHLPDGYNLGKFLRQYTPLKSYHGYPDFGFVWQPQHAIAHKFIVCAKKYT